MLPHSYCTAERPAASSATDVGGVLRTQQTGTAAEPRSPCVAAAAVQIDAPTLSNMATLDTSRGGSFTCYEVKSGVATPLSDNNIIPNDGRGKVINCFVEYKNLGANCNPGEFQPDNTSPCTTCPLDSYCPGEQNQQQSVNCLSLRNTQWSFNSVNNRAKCNYSRCV